MRQSCCRMVVAPHRVETASRARLIVWMPGPTRWSICSLANSTVGRSMTVRSRCVGNLADQGVTKNDRRAHLSRAEPWEVRARYMSIASSSFRSRVAGLDDQAAPPSSWPHTCAQRSVSTVGGVRGAVAGDVQKEEQGEPSFAFLSGARDVERVLDTTSTFGHRMAPEDFVKMMVSLSAAAIEGPTALTEDPRFLQAMRHFEQKLNVQAQRSTHVTPQEIAEVLTGFVKLKYHPNHSLMARLVEWWLQLYTSHEGRKSRGFVRVLNALHESKQEPAPGLLRAALADYGRVGDFSRAEVKNFVYLVDRLRRFKLDADSYLQLLGAVQRCIKDTTIACDIKELSRLVFLLGKLSGKIRAGGGAEGTLSEHDVQHMRRDVACELTQACVDISAPTAAPLALLIRGLGDLIRPGMTRQSFRLNGSGHQHGGNEWLEPILQRMPGVAEACRRAGFDGFTEEDIAWVLDGFALVGYQPEPGFLEEMVLARVRFEEGGCNKQALIGILGHLTKLRYASPSPDLLRALVAACLEVGYDEFTPTEAARVIWSLGRLRYHPGDACLRQFVERCSSDGWKSLQAADLAVALEGLCMLRYRLDQVAWGSYMDAWHAVARSWKKMLLQNYTALVRLLASCDKLETEEALNLLRGLSERMVMVIQKMGKTASVVEEEGAAEPPHDMTHEATHKGRKKVTHTGVLNASFRSLTYSQCSLLPDDAKENGWAGQVWKELDKILQALMDTCTARRMTPARPSAPSSTRLDMARHLEDSGYRVKVKQVPEKAGTAVDMLLFPNDDQIGRKPVAVQIELPEHYFSNRPEVLTGDEVLRRRVLDNAVKRRVLESCVYIRRRQWENANGPEAKSNLLELKLLESGVRLADYSVSQKRSRIAEAVSDRSEAALPPLHEHDEVTAANV